MTSRPMPHRTTSLHRDLFAAGAARLRRRQRVRELGLGTLGVAIAALTLTLMARTPDRDSTIASEADSAPDSVPEAHEAPTHKAFETIESDEELLDLLRGQGAVLVTHPDGRRQLILTRPEAASHY